MKKSDRLDKNDIDFLLNKKFLTQKEVANIFNVGYMTISRFCKKNQIFVRTTSDLNKIRYTKRLNGLNPKEIFENHWIKNKSIYEISKECGIGHPQFLDFLNKNKIPYKGKRYKILENVNDVIDLYVKDKLSLKQIGKKFKVSQSTVKKYLLEKSIKIRPSYSYGKEYKLPSGKIINVRGFESNFLDFVFENNLLRESDIKKGKVFSYIFNGKKKKYHSDFYIPRLNLIVEIKSWYIEKLQGIEKNYLKKLSVLDSGFDYCYILDNDFSEFYEKINKI